MASSNIPNKRKMLVGLEIDHGEDDKAYVIHKIDDWTIDDSDNNKILITSHDAERRYSSKKRIARDISKYVKLIHINRKTARKSKKYFAVWKNAPRNYTSIYYPCKIARNESASIKATRTTIKINYYDPEYKNKNFNLNFSHNFDEDKVIPSIIEGEQLTSFALYFLTTLIIMIVCNSDIFFLAFGFNRRRHYFIL